jgi:PKD repeat protein
MRNKIQLSLFLTLLIIGVQGKFASVYANPTVDFSYTGLCVGSQTQFTVDYVLPNISNITEWKWVLGDGNFSTEKNPLYSYGGPGTYTVTLTIKDNLGHYGSASHTITIQQLPAPSFYYDTPNCSADSIKFTDLSTTPDGYINEWKWDFNDGSPIENILLPNSPNPKHLFPTDGTYNVSLTVINSVNSCQNTIFLPVTVTPGPIANFNFDGKCEDQVVSFTDASFANGAGNIALWDWNFGDVTSGINNTSNLINPTHNFNNAGTYTVTLKIKNFNGCTASIVKQVVINPHPPVEFTNTTPCLGEQVSFNPDPSIINLPSIASYHWDFGDGVTSNAGITSHAFSSTGDYLVTLQVTDLLGCRNEVSHTIKVNSLPVAQFSTNLSYCVGAKVEFQDLSSISSGYISSWEWDFGDGNTKFINQPDDPNLSHIYALAGSYYVTLRINSSTGCNTTVTHLLIINSKPLANFTITPACKGTPTEFSDLTQLNGALAIMQWQWDFGDAGSGTSNFSALQNPEHAFVATGNSTVKLIVTNGNGCIDSVKRTIRVSVPPLVNFSTSQNCQNKAVTFIPDAAVMNIASIASWYWEFGSGVPSVLQNPSHIFTTAGTHSVKLTVVDTSGCTNTISKSVSIASEPVVRFSFPQPVCVQSSVQFDNLSNVPGSFIVKSEWDFGDGNTQIMNTLASVSHIYTTYGTYTASLKITSNEGCEKTLSLPVVILPAPLADFSVSSTCLSSLAQFTDLSQAGVGGITGWSWKFGDPTSGINNVSSVKLPSHTYNTAGSFPVSLIVSNSGGCIDTIVKQVLIHGLPVADFTFTPGCVNGSTHFVCSTFVNTGAISSYSWNFGDGQSLQGLDPTHIYLNSGSFTVTITVTDTTGCTSTKSHLVVIADPPTAVFDIAAQTCSGNPVLFSVLPSAGSPVTSYLWEFGDGKDTLINAPASGNVSHIYAYGNNYTVVLTVKTALGCEAKSQRALTISPGPAAKFSYENSCTGAATSFKDLSVVNSGPSIVNWSWNFNDPSSFSNNISGLQNPYHVFNTAGTYIVSLTVGNSSGCYNTVTKSVVINPKPAVDFDWSGSCIGSTKFTVNTSVTNISTIASYNWDFGDGSVHDVTRNPVHNYMVTGNHTVILTIVTASGCKNSVSKIVSISPQPSAFFSSNSSCLGTSTEFTDESFYSTGVPVTAWHWDFGVNANLKDTSNLQNPTWIYKTLGVYEVKLTVTAQNGCQNTVTLPSQVFGNPTANFTYTVSPCGKGAVYFQDSSYNKQAPIISYDWEFEANHFSTLQDPVYVFYSADSCYDVRLIAKDVRGCVDTIVKQACVPAEFDFSFSATNNCLFDSAYFSPLEMSNSTGTLASFYWNFGDPKSGTNNISTKRLPAHYYDQPGTYSVSLSAIDIYNCSKMIYREITVLPQPVSYFTSTEGACDSSMYFNEASYSTGSTISRWTWEFGDGVVQTIVAPDSPDISHKYAVPGQYTVSLTVVNSTGCTSKTTVTGVVVKPCLEAAFQLYDTLTCQNNILTFLDKSNASNTTNEWYWDFGDGTHLKYSSYINRISHKYTSSGNFKVQLILSTIVTGKKVSDTSKLSVNVNPTPLPDFIFGVVCHEQTAVFTNMTSGNGTKIVSYNWNFGEPLSESLDTSTLKNPSHLFKTPGTYDITLVVKNTIGCTDSIRKSLIVHGLPEANYTYSISCAGNNTAFVDLSVAAAASLAKWDWTYYNYTGITGKSDIQNPDFIFTVAGDYLVNLQVTDIYGCMDTINQIVTTWTVPTSIFSYTENYDNVQGQLQFENNSVDATKYYWDFGNGTYSYSDKPIANYENDGTYEITLVSRNDKECTDTLVMNYDFMVKSLFIPNAFSPENLKTEVQLLKPVGINLVEYSFEVYDRWGNLLWKTDKLDDLGRPLEGWDGKFKGKVMPEGAYPWRASGQFKDGSVWEGENVGNNDHLPDAKVGTATLIR